MIEIPEAFVLADQIDKTLKGKKIESAIAGFSSHKFAWYSGDPAEYSERLAGRTIRGAAAYGGRIEIDLEDLILWFGDGVNIRYCAARETLPQKHQLLVCFEDKSAMVCSVAMYGGLWCRKRGEINDFYSLAAREKVSPLSKEFDYRYFCSVMAEDENAHSLSAKAFLATEQRFPGLGNGVLQDILLNAKIHPKEKMDALSEAQSKALFASVKSTLAEITSSGGRDTEKDLFGNPGAYKTKLSKKNVFMRCPHCGGMVRKESYLGGSVYFCETCQVPPKK